MAVLIITAAKEELWRSSMKDGEAVQCGGRGWMVGLNTHRSPNETRLQCSVLTKVMTLCHSHLGVFLKKQSGVHYTYFKLEDGFVCENKTDF